MNYEVFKKQAFDMSFLDGSFWKSKFTTPTKPVNNLVQKEMQTQQKVNDLQRIRHDYGRAAASGQALPDISKLPVEQKRYVMAGDSNSGYSIPNTNEYVKGLINNPGQADKDWNNNRRQEVVQRWRNENASGNIVSQKQMAGLTPQEQSQINETRGAGIQALKARADKGKVPDQRTQDALTQQERYFVTQKQNGYYVPQDAFKDPEAVKKWLADRQNMVKGNTKDTSVLGAGDKWRGFWGSDISDEGQAAMFEQFKKENPNFMPSFVDAVKSASPDAIKELQKFAVSGKDGTSFFNEEEMKQITGAAQTASWNAIKEDPFTNLPKVMGLFLRQQGFATGAEYAESPLVFYGGLLALLFGGGALLSGGSSNQPTVVNNYYGQQQPKGYNIVPYA